MTDERPSASEDIRALRRRVRSKLGGEPVPEPERVAVTYPPEIGDPETGVLRSVAFWTRPFAGQIVDPSDFTIVAWDREEGALVWAREDDDDWEELRAAIEFHPRRYDVPPRFPEEIFEVLSPLDVAIRWLQCRGVDPTFQVRSETRSSTGQEASRGSGTKGA